MSIERSVARVFGIGFDGTTIPAETAALVARGVRCLVLFKRNIESAGQVRELTADAKKLANGEPLAIAIDHEGGRVARLSAEFTQIPSAREIGRCDDLELTRDIGAVMGRELRAANIDINFAPVLDVDTNPDNPVIAGRSFGRQAELVVRMGCALIAGLQANGVAACGKHFPGHGDTSQDTHFDLPRLEYDLERLERVELRPFAAAIGWDVAAMMSSHIVFSAIEPNLPATMSHAILQGILRRRLGFGGVIISDDLEMKAIAANYSIEQTVIEGAKAGIDLFLICRDHCVQQQAIDALTNAVKHGVVSRDCILQANERIDRLFERYVKPATGVEGLAVIGATEHRKVIERVRAGLPATSQERDPTAGWQ